ncbi:hypothetical protein HDK64DRAFT_252697 [Phyllosticta capitalensis]
MAKQTNFRDFQLPHNDEENPQAFVYPDPTQLYDSRAPYYSWPPPDPPRSITPEPPLAADNGRTERIESPRTATSRIGPTLESTPNGPNEHTPAFGGGPTQPRERNPALGDTPVQSNNSNAPLSVNNSNNNDRVERLFRCNFCPRSYTRIDIRRRHERTDHPHLCMSCRLCGYLVAKTPDLESHLRSSHRDAL